MHVLKVKQTCKSFVINVLVYYWEIRLFTHSCDQSMVVNITVHWVYKNIHWIRATLLHYIDACSNHGQTAVLKVQLVAIMLLKNKTIQVRQKNHTVYGCSALDYTLKLHSKNNTSPCKHWSYLHTSSVLNLTILFSLHQYIYQ